MRAPLFDAGERYMLAVRRRNLGDLEFDGGYYLGANELGHIFGRLNECGSQQFYRRAFGRGTSPIGVVEVEPIYPTLSEAEREFALRTLRRKAAAWKRKAPILAIPKD